MTAAIQVSIARKNGSTFTTSVSSASRNGTDATMNVSALATLQPSGARLSLPYPSISSSSPLISPFAAPYIPPCPRILATATQASTCPSHI